MAYWRTWCFVYSYPSWIDSFEKAKLVDYCSRLSCLPFNCLLCSTFFSSGWWGMAHHSSYLPISPLFFRRCTVVIASSLLREKGRMQPLPILLRFDRKVIPEFESDLTISWLQFNWLLVWFDQCVSCVLHFEIAIHYVLIIKYVKIMQTMNSL